MKIKPFNWLIKRPGKYKFLVSYKPQEWPKLLEKFTPSWEDSETTPKPKPPSASNPKALELRLANLQYEICPPGTSLF